MNKKKWKKTLQSLTNERVGFPLVITKHIYCDLNVLLKRFLLKIYVTSRMVKILTNEEYMEIFFTPRKLKRCSI